jgi:hypothetical protein
MLHSRRVSAPCLLVASLSALVVVGTPAAASGQDTPPAADAEDVADTGDASEPAPATPPTDLPPADPPPAAPPPAYGPATYEPASDGGYVRHGFTMELGIGISHTAVSARSGYSEREHAAVGLAPLSFAFGGFLTPRLALLGRGAGTSTFRKDASGKTYQTVNAVYGPTLQYWATDRFFVGGGPGVAVLAADLYGQTRDARVVEIGLGLNGRVGFAFALPGDHHALSLMLDVFGSRFSNTSTLAGALNLGWQFL